MHHLRVRLPVRHGDDQYVTEVVRDSEGRVCDFRVSIYPPSAPLLAADSRDVQAAFRSFVFRNARPPCRRYRSGAMAPGLCSRLRCAA